MKRSCINIDVYEKKSHKCIQRHKVFLDEDAKMFSISEDLKINVINSIGHSAYHLCCPDLGNRRCPHFASIFLGNDLANSSSPQMNLGKCSGCNGSDSMPCLEKKAI